MPQTITTGYKQLLEDANSRVRTVEVAEARAMLERDGKIPGAFHCPRGMLEFWIDPESPYAKPQFQREAQFLFFCGGGWRSALAADVAQKMGLKPVAHLGGGFAAWRKAGAPIEAYRVKPANPDPVEYRT